MGNFYIKGYNKDYSVTLCGKIYSHKNNKFLRGGLNSKGYRCVCLYNKGTRKVHTFHRLIISTLKQNYNVEKMEINHIDGNKDNNKIDNLEWSTRSENVKHAYDIGLKKASRGSKHNQSKLNETMVLELRELMKNVKNVSKVSRMTGIERSTLSNIKRRKTWTHI